MKQTSADLLAHFALRMPLRQSVCTCCRIERRDGTVFGFTEHDFTLTVSGWADSGTRKIAFLNGTYAALGGILPSDVSTSSAMNVDNLETVLSQFDVTAQDVFGGKWDYAKSTVFLVNWKNLAQGPHFVRHGHLGEISTEILSVRAEIRGLMQAYSQTIGELTSPTCRNNFGDAKCGVDLTPFTVTGTVESVNPDGLTLYDSSRTEAGAAAGIDITGISNANPGVVTMLNGSLNLIDGQPITIANVVGMERLNKVTVARYPSGNTFKLTVDTTDTELYGVYASGGTVSTLGGGRSFFDGGRITLLSGLNEGLSEDVKSYAPGQITLSLPMPFPVNGTTNTHGDPIEDRYSLVRGCGKQFLANCIGDYSNGRRFRGEPWVRGIDTLVQFGRS